MIGKLARLSLLAALLGLAGAPVSGQIEISFKFGGGKEKLAKNLAQAVSQVRLKFGADRLALPLVKGVGGAPAYSRQAVLDLVDSTAKELDHAVERVKEPNLAGLESWARNQIESSRKALEKPAGSGETGKPSGTAELAEPRGGVVFAAFRSGGKPKTPPRKPAPKAAPPAPPAPPQPDPLEATTVPVAESNSVLDQVGRVIERLFVLADTNDLEVELWVGSTPRDQADFSFSAQSAAKGAPLKPTTLRTNGSRKHVLRGLYKYRASLSKGSKAVKEILESGQRSDGGMQSDPLDLVDGSRFFCCRFDDNYCHHVDDPKQCQPQAR